MIVVFDFDQFFQFLIKTCLEFLSIFLTMSVGNHVKDDEWRIALRQVIESLAKRNAAHKKIQEIRDRTSVGIFYFYY